MPDPPSTELAQLLIELDWSPRALARRLGISDSTTRQWQTGRREAPPSVIEWLRAIRQRVESAGLPKGWEPC